MSEVPSLLTTNFLTKGLGSKHRISSFLASFQVGKDLIVLLSYKPLFSPWLFWLWFSFLFLIATTSFSCLNIALHVLHIKLFQSGFKDIWTEIEVWSLCRIEKFFCRKLSRWNMKSNIWTAKFHTLVKTLLSYLFFKATGVKIIHDFKWLQKESKNTPQLGALNSINTGTITSLYGQIFGWIQDGGNWCTITMKVVNRLNVYFLSYFALFYKTLNGKLSYRFIKL